MKRPPGRPELVGDALQHLLRRVDRDRRIELFRLWPAEVGDALAARTAPSAFRDGVLTVSVSGAAWMQELQFVKEDIRTRLNDRLGSELVRDIYFVAGSMPAAPPRRRAAQTPPPDTSDEPAEPIDFPRLRDQRMTAVFERLSRAKRRN